MEKVDLVKVLFSLFMLKGNVLLALLRLILLLPAMLVLKLSVMNRYVNY